MPSTKTPEQRRAQTENARLALAAARKQRRIERLTAELNTLGYDVVPRG